MARKVVVEYPCIAAVFVTVGVMARKVVVEYSVNS